MNEKLLEDQLLKVSEVARTFRVDNTTVRRWVKQGILEAVTLPSGGERVGYRIKQSTMNKLLHPVEE